MVVVLLLLLLWLLLLFTCAVAVAVAVVGRDACKDSMPTDKFNALSIPGHVVWQCQSNSSVLMPYHTNYL